MSNYLNGTVYTGVVGPEDIPVRAFLSILNIKRRDGDAIPKFSMSTKGYVGRQQHIDLFMTSEHDWILLLDHDMLFEDDTLERLRSHGQPYVSGYYMRRRIQPMAPVWFEPFSGEWPMRPWTSIPARDTLHELGASGWGCILIHRDVIETTRALVLNGEQDVIEDDMDVWPYDLAKVLAGEEMIRPLRACKDVVGSDIRYPFYAKAAGFTLYGDAAVRPSHILSYGLRCDDYDLAPEAERELYAQHIDEQVAERRDGIRERLGKLQVVSV